MAGQRGLYRSVHCSLVDDPEYQELSPGARHTLLTLRMCRDCTTAGIFRYYLTVLLEQTGYSPDEQEKHLAGLEAGGWILRDKTVLWVKNALKYEPSISLKNEKHIEGVRNHLRALPRTAILTDFLNYYPETLSADLTMRAKESSLPDGSGQKAMGIDTHTIPIRMGIDTLKRVEKGNRSLSSESESESETESETEKKSAREAAPVPSPIRTEPSRPDPEPEPLTRTDHTTAGVLAKWIKDQLVKRSPQGAHVFEPEIITGLLKIKGDTRYSWKQITTVIKWAAGQEFWIDKLRSLQKPAKRHTLPEWFETIRGNMRTGDSKTRGAADDAALDERVKSIEGKSLPRSGLQRGRLTAEALTGGNGD